MRTTVRSVGGSYGLGSRCLKSSITAALAQTASDRSPSMTGASDGSILTALTLGRMNIAGAVAEPGGAAAATKVNPAGGSAAFSAATATSHEVANASATSDAPAPGVKPSPRNPVSPNI